MYYIYTYPENIKKIFSQSYTDCTCIPSHTAEKGGCGGTCYGRLWTAIIITSVGNFIALLSVPAHNIVGMRYGATLVVVICPKC